MDTIITLRKAIEIRDIEITELKNFNFVKTQELLKTQEKLRKAEATVVRKLAVIERLRLKRPPKQDRGNYAVARDGHRVSKWFTTYSCAAKMVDTIFDTIIKRGDEHLYPPKEGL